MLRRVGGWLFKGASALGIALFALATAILGFAALAEEVGVASRIVIGPGLGAGTLEGSLVLAYQNNPQLNSQRAATRAADENVGTALSGYRPRLTGTSSLTEQYLDTTAKTTSSTGAPAYIQGKGAAAVSNFGVTATQTLYNGLQTGNRTRQAEQQVYAAREVLRSTEQTVLLNGATAYMNLLRDAAILELQRSNVNVLEVTLRQTRDRFAAGEVTRTDVAQAESSLAAGRSQLAAAESNYLTSRANYRQVIGVEPPARLAPGAPVDRLSPRTLDASIGRSRSEHPTITTSMYNVDVALLQVKIAEGALYPTVQAVGNVQKNFGASPNSLAVLESLSATVAAQLSVPLYQGGAEYSTIRQAKETLGQRRLDLDTARDQVQAAVVQAWGQLEVCQGADHCHPSPGDFGGSCTQWRARRSPRRPAHHPRRAQCPADLGQCAGCPGDGATRSGRGVVYPARRRREPLAPGARASDRGLRCDGALPAGARCLGRRPDPGRALTSGYVCLRLLRGIDMPYWFHSDG